MSETYVVLGNVSEGQLAKEADLYIARGWRPTGGVAIGKDGRFHQAMIRPPQPEEQRFREPAKKK